MENTIMERRISLPPIASKLAAYLLVFFFGDLLDELVAAP